MVNTVTQKILNKVWMKFLVDWQVVVPKSTQKVKLKPCWSIALERRNKCLLGWSRKCVLSASSMENLLTEKDCVTHCSFNAIVLKRQCASQLFLWKRVCKMNLREQQKFQLDLVWKQNAVSEIQGSHRWDAETNILPWKEFEKDFKCYLTS